MELQRWGQGKLCGQHAGFNLHAATRVEASDEQGRLALCKYILRPPLANERLSVLADDVVRLEFKKPWSDGTSSAELAPLALIARLAALVPPPPNNLLAREEEREMLPLCADAGVGTIVWSPLARGRLSRAWDAAKTTRSQSDPFADMLYSPRTAESDRIIIDTVGEIAAARGVGRAQIALAWLRKNPVVVAPIVGAGKIEHVDDAVASLEVNLTASEIERLERPYTPRYDFQGVSDSAELKRIMSQIPQFEPR